MGKTWGATYKRKHGSKRLKNRHYNRLVEQHAANVMLHGEGYELSGCGRGWLEYHKGKCDGKVAYGTVKEADAAKRRYDKMFDESSTVYECPICGKWHLTTHPWEGRN